MRSSKKSVVPEEEATRAKRKRKMAPQLLRVPKFRRPSITKRKRKRNVSTSATGATAMVAEYNVRAAILRISTIWPRLQILLTSC